MHKPKRLAIKIGINDVNRHLANGLGSVSPRVYRETYDELLTRMRAERPDCEIYLIQPFYLSRMTDPQSYRTRVLEALKEYHAVVREMTEKFGGKVLETHQMFQKHLDVYHQNELAGEPVHVNRVGHTILAEAFLGLLS